MATNKLSSKFCNNAKPGTYFDGEGLYLLVEKNGKKYWRHSTYFQGKPKLVAPLTLVQGRLATSYFRQV